MLEIFYSVLPIFLIAILGCVIRFKWLSSDEFWRGLEKLSFYVLFPAMLFQNTSHVTVSNHDLGLLIASLIFANILISVGLIIYQHRVQYDRFHFTSVFQGATRYNSYIFFALGAGWLGQEGMQIIASIAPYMLVLTNLTAILAFYYYIPPEDRHARKNGVMLLLKSVFGNPLIFASVGGIIFNYLGLELNHGLANSLKTLSDAAFAVGMLIVGAGMRFNINPEHFPHIIVSSVLKLIITPIITVIILWFFGVGSTARSVGILFSCLPCATTSYLLSRQLGGNADSMSAIITVSTICSIVSLSLLIYILG